MAAAAAAASSDGSCGISVYAASEEKTNGTRLARLLVDVGTHVLRKAFHSVHPTATLKHVLNNNLRMLQNLKFRHVIFDDQWEKLFPTSGDPPDSKTFDITLLHLLLREICHLTAPPTGWHKMPADDDVSLEANIVRIKCFRNELCHSVSTGIPNGEFEDKWNKIASSLKELETSVHEKKLQDLKSDPIDHDMTRRVEVDIEQWKREHEEGEVMSELCSCLPDKMPEEWMFGRTQEIQQVIEFVHSGTVDVVLITGGPGFGKTTMAKRVAHELANQDNERTVLFCSLVTKRVFNEVATEMIHSCDRIHTHVPENPEQWLKNWSKQIKTQVTFVLDNADGVLESKDRNSFVKMLSALRISSRQNVTFVVTSRKTLTDPDLQSKEVLLKLVSVEDAKNILVTRVSDQDVRQKLSRTERIVELCGGIPLALCIVGSLLSDFTEERLIKHLEEQPLAVLKDDETSVENAIKASFDLLTQTEHKEAFVLMSVFSRPFNSDAAEAVMEACSISGTLPGSIIRALKNRSLLEQPIPRIYLMHPLIQAFAKNIGEAEYPHLVAAGEKLACAHFMSRLAKNANRCWSKDRCKESVEAFDADRHNFEYFLHIYAQAREKKDCDIMESCKIFLDDFPQKSMYLEMCVLPGFYISILKRLLETFDSETQPVHRVELLCLLGHEYRKAEKEKYRELMMEVHEIHTKNRAEFETSALSEVYFRNSYVRFLSDKKDRNEAGRIEEETEAVLQVSRELGEHPERAATLLYAGIHEKRRKKPDEAHQKLKESLELFKRCLGEHFMTAQSLKAIADLYFFIGKTEADLDIGLAHYESAIKMVDDLGMGASKASFLTLKNFGQCHRKKKNFDEAKKLLTKAEQVSERELEGDHTWKISIKTELAILHGEMGNEDQAKDLMLEGLLMGKRLNLPVDKMGNRVKIGESIDRYPETFPKTEFPRE